MVAKIVGDGCVILMALVNGNSSRHTRSAMPSNVICQHMEKSKFVETYSRKTIEDWPAHTVVSLGMTMQQRAAEACPQYFLSSSINKHNDFLT